MTNALRVLGLLAMAASWATPGEAQAPAGSQPRVARVNGGTRLTSAAEPDSTPYRVRDAGALAAAHPELGRLQPAAFQFTLTTRNLTIPGIASVSFVGFARLSADRALFPGIPAVSLGTFRQVNVVFRARGGRTYIVDFEMSGFGASGQPETATFLFGMSNESTTTVVAAGDHHGTVAIHTSVDGDYAFGIERVGSLHEWEFRRLTVTPLQ